MKIAIIAPPWLSTYPGCYYGIENVIENLTSTLHQLGHEVVLFGVGDSTTEASRRFWYHQDDQYKHVHRPWYQAVPIISSHILYSLNVIKNHGDFDIIHDHNSFVGPAMMAFAYGNLPPVLHTLHEPFTDDRLAARGIPDNHMLFNELKYGQGMYFNGISHSQLSTAPKDLDSRILDIIPNGVDLDDYIYSEKKDDYFVILGRVSPDKGQSTAAKVCKEMKVPLKIAGTIGGDISTVKQLKTELKTPTGRSLRNNPDFTYFAEEVQPHLVKGRVEYVGTIFGQEKMKLLSKAKAFLAPITWEEPFGIAVVDALACGTPVIAYRRGAFPEIIQHGVNGFLVDNEDEMKEYMQRLDEIDPAACRKSVEDNFSALKMTKRYIELYERVIRLAHENGMSSRSAHPVEIPSHV